MEDDKHVNAKLASFAIILCVLIIVLFVGRAYINKMMHVRTRQDCHSTTQTPQGRIALVLVGEAPSATVLQCRVRSWLSNSRWAASVVCFASLNASLEHQAFSVDIWPLRL